MRAQLLDVQMQQIARSRDGRELRSPVRSYCLMPSDQPTYLFAPLRDIEIKRVKIPCARSRSHDWDVVGCQAAEEIVLCIAPTEAGEIRNLL